jgi:hypothetical protein
MALKDQNPAALSQLQRIDWSVDWIKQLKGQVWGLIQNGGGGGGGTQNLQSVLGYGNTALFQLISLLANGNSELTVSNTDNPSILLRSENGTNGINFFVDDTFTQVIFFNENIGTKLSLEPSGPILTSERVKIPVDTAFPLGESGILLLSDLLGRDNGIATLDGSGLIPSEQLPYSVAEYKGTWNAATNIPALSDTMIPAPNNGDFYVVSVGATRDLGSGPITFIAGNVVIFNGTLGIWQQAGGLAGTVTNVSSANNIWATVANGSTTPSITIVAAPMLKRADASQILINNVEFTGASNITLDQVINPQTGTTYGFVLADNQKLVTANNSSSQTYTVPTTTAQAFPVGAQIDLIQLGTGNVTFAAATNVTLRSKGNFKTVNGAYTGVTLKKISNTGPGGEGEWVLMGNLI